MNKHLQAKIRRKEESLTLYYKKHFNISVQSIIRYFNKISFPRNVWEIENV